MKLLAGLLISLSLTLGVIASTNAYHPRLSRIDATMELTLAGPVGRSAEDPTRPLFTKGPATEPRRLSQEMITALAAQMEPDGVTPTVRRVPVAEFRFDLWDGRWYFLLSVIGLCSGAFLVRIGTRARLRALADRSSGAARDRMPPEMAMRGAAEELDRLVALLPGLRSDEERLETILHRADGITRREIDAFIEGREELVGRLGLAGYARLMDAFAAGERMLNRAWSAAADHALDEAVASLHVAQARWREAVPLATAEPASR